MLSADVRNGLVGDQEANKKNEKKNPLGGGHVTKPQSRCSFKGVKGKTHSTFRRSFRQHTKSARSAPRHLPSTQPRHVIDTGLPQEVYVKTSFIGRAQETQTKKEKDIINKSNPQEGQLCHPRRGRGFMDKPSRIGLGR
jgi:hypothetical protein